MSALSRILRKIWFLPSSQSHPLSIFQSFSPSELKKILVPSGTLCTIGLVSYVAYTANSTTFASTGTSLDLTKFMAEPITDVLLLNSSLSEMRSKMEVMIMEVQGSICRTLEKFEPEKKFFVDKWSREEGGGGISCVLQNGQTFDKAGVNISVVHGTLGPEAAKQMRARGKNFGDQVPFFAVGISSVIHPVNPFVPTVHFNFRYFEASDQSGESIWWFGGGTDLTPTYLDEWDAKHFHSALKVICDRHDKGYYENFKAFCDRYFFLPHRGERRGVGGIFFDDLDQPDGDSVFAFVEDCVRGFLNAYLPIVEKHYQDPFTVEERQFQSLRRGRYVEFNLLHDRGTKFGLNTPGARIESILMSLPLTARWEYGHTTVDPREVELREVLVNPRNWID